MATYYVGKYVAEVNGADVLSYMKHSGKENYYGNKLYSENTSHEF